MLDDMSLRDRPSDSRSKSRNNNAENGNHSFSKRLMNETPLRASGSLFSAHDHQDSMRASSQNGTSNWNKHGKGGDFSPERGSVASNMDRSNFGWEIVSPSHEDAKSLQNLKRAVR
jgi:hypothetical protein